MTGFQPLTPDSLNNAMGVATLNTMLKQLFQNVPGDGNTIQDVMGYGSPEGVITAGIGSTYRRIDGGAGTSNYTKQTGTGNTGWVALATAASFTGIIAQWSGSIVSIPSGWVICDGTNGTPDLRDKFVVGAGSTYAVGATGGEATHVLTTAEMPAHTHTSHAGESGGGALSGSQAWATGISYGDQTESTGGGGAHNNLPPYYALAYIMHT